MNNDRMPLFSFRPGLLAGVFLCILMLVSAGARPAQAACANPAGEAGAIVYNAAYNLMQFCNGSIWNSMASDTPIDWITSGNNLYYNSGSVGVGAASVPASAVFAVTSTTKGMLLPRMTSAQVSGISSAAEGLVVYDTTLKKILVRNNSAWSDLSGTLNNLSCASGELSQWNGSAWACKTFAATSGLNYRLNEAGMTNAGTSLPAALFHSSTAVIGGYVYMFGGDAGGTTVNTIYRAPVSNPKAMTATGGVLPGILSYSHPLIVGNYIYLFGGNGPSGTATVIYRALLSDPVNTWELAGNLPIPVRHSQIAMINGYIYLFGGYNSATISTILRASVSDPTTWSVVGSLPTPVYEAAVFVVDDYVYLIGGHNGSSVLNTIYRAPTSNPVSGWTNTNATLPAALSYMYYAVIGDYMYVMGGYTGSATNVVYRAHLSSPTTWVNTGVTLPGSMYGAAYAVVGDEVYIYGGHNGTSYLSSIYRANTYLVTRSTRANVSQNVAWTVMNTPLGGVTQDSRIGTVANSKWCATDGSGNINCNQDTPVMALSALSDVTASSPTNGQRLIYNTGTSKWEASTTIAPSCATGEIAQWDGSDWVCANRLNIAGLNYRLHENNWVNAGSLPGGGHYLSYPAVIGDYVYLFGGDIGGSAVSTIYRAPKSNPTVWTNIGTLPSVMRYSHVAVIGNYAYLFGGNTGPYTNVIWRAPLDNLGGGWVDAGSLLPGNVGLGSLAIIGSYVYLFGGYNSGAINIIYRAPVANPTNWSSVGTLPINVYGARVAVIGDYVYMFGGHNGSATLNTIYRAPVSDPLTWTNTGATLPSALYYSAHAIIGDYIYTFGGWNGSAYLSAVYRAPLSNPLNWVNTGASMPGTTNGNAAFIAGDNVYSIGGHNGGYISAIYRAPTYMLGRQTNIDLAGNLAWNVLTTPMTNTRNDERIGTLNNSQWCKTDGSGLLNCDQNTPVATLGALSDVTAASPTDGQKLVYSTGTSKWVATTPVQPNCALGEIVQWTGSAWSCFNGKAVTGLNYHMHETGWMNTGYTLPGSVYGGTTAVVGNYVYLFGGHNGSAYTSKIFRAPVSNPTAWTDTGKFLPGARHGASLVVIGQYLYMFGGHNGGAYTNEILRASVDDPTTWTNPGPTLPTVIAWSNTAVIGQYVYLFAGYTGSYVSKIYRAPVSNPLAWTDTLANVPSANHGAAVTVIGDYVYMFGGHNGSAYLNTIYRAPVSDPLTWTNTGKVLPGTNYLSQVVVVGDYVYFLGGHNGGYLSSIWRAPVSDPTTWTNTGATLPSGLGYAHAAVVGDDVFLFGGYSSGVHNSIYRARTYMFARQNTTDLASNMPWLVLSTPLTGTINDSRIGTVNNSQWCVTDSGSVMNCDQAAPGTTLAALSNVAAASPVDGQKLVYNTTTSKWTATTPVQPNCAVGEIVQWTGSTWSCVNKKAVSGLNYHLNEFGWVNTGATLPTNNHGALVATIGDYIYMFGGHNGGAYLNTIYRAPKSNPLAWVNTGKTLPGTVGYANSGTMVIGNTVYIFGGLINGAAGNAIYSAPLSDPTTWSVAAGTLPGGVYGGQVAVINGFIYVFGGYNGGYLNIIYRANVNNPLVWTSAGTLPTPLYGSHLVVVGDYVYLYGGHNGSAYTGNIYRAPVSDPTAWTITGSATPVPVYTGQLAVVGDYIYIFGGYNGSSYSNSVLRAPLSNPLSWTTTGGTVPAGMHWSTFAIVNDNLYLFGNHNGSAVTNTIFRAPTYLYARQSTLDVASNDSWRVLTTPLTNTLNDSRISTVSNSKWCQTNGSGVLSCDQDAPNTALAGMTDVASATPTDGQKLVYNSGTSKWTPTTTVQPSCALGEIVQWSGSAWSCVNKNATSGMNFHMLESGWVNTGSTLPTVIHVGSLVTVGDYIYILGGHNGGMLNTIMRAKKSNPLAWVNTGATLPTSLYTSNPAVIGDYVYLFGGYNGSVHTGAILRAPVSNPTSWTNTGASLPGPVSSGNVAVIGDYVYLFGGHNGSTPTNLIYRAPKSNPLAWTNTGVTLPGATYAASMAIVGDYIYLYVGYNGSYVNYIYRAPVSNPLAWSNTNATLPSTMHASQLVIVGDYMYMLGGYNGSGYSSAIYRASIKDPLSWVNTGQGIVSGNHWGQAAVIDDHVYMFGGHNGSAVLSAIYRAPTYMFARQTNADVTRNHSWQYVATSLANSANDLRIGTVNNNEWCVTDSGSVMNCDQAASNTLVALSDVDISSPSNGQKLVYNSGISKWTAVTPIQPNCTVNELMQWSGSAWSCVSKAYTAGLNYHMHEGSWTNTGSIPSGLYGPQFAAIGDYVYLFGGSNGSGTNVIYRSTKANPNIWTNTGKVLPTGLHGAQLAVVGDYIYLFGGYNTSGTVTNSIFRAPVSDPTDWSNTGSTLPTALGWAGLATVNGYLYLFGGNPGTASNLIYRASVSNPLSWQLMPGTLPQANHAQSTIIIGDYIYMYGGHNGSAVLNTIWRAPVSDPTAWTNTTATLPGTTHLSHPIIVGDYVYLMGGHNGGSMNSVWRAPLSDPTKMMNTGATLPGAVHGGQAAVIDDNVYLFTGVSSSTYTTNVFRASTYLFTRQAAVDISRNASWLSMSAPVKGVVNDNRIATLTNSKWCKTDGSGNLNCDQDPGASALATLTDVAAATPTDGQKLIYNSGTSKWTPTTVSASNLSCATNEIPGWNGSAWACVNKISIRNLNYRVEEFKWINTGSTIVAALSDSSLIKNGDDLYLFGGWNGSSTMSVIYKASANSPTAWTNTGATLPAPLRNYGASAVIGGYIYLFGGHNSSGTTTRVIYRASVNTPTVWENTGALLPGPIAQNRVIVIGSYVYSLGGHNGSVYTRVIWRAPVSDPTNWSDTGVLLPGALSLSHLAVVGSDVYMFGGLNAVPAYTNVIYRAPVSDPVTGWVDTGKTLPGNVGYGHLAIVGDYMYIFGGFNLASSLNVIYKAPLNDPTTWVNTGATLPSNLSGSQLAVINDSVYTFGGNTGSISSVIYRAPVYLFTRMTNVTAAADKGWAMLTAPLTGGTQDERIGATITDGKWCAVNGSGIINCDQDTPSTSLAGLTDVSVPAPTNGQKLVFNSGTGKWQGGTVTPTTLSCATYEVPKWNGSAWTCTTNVLQSGMNFRMNEGSWQNTSAVIPAVRYAGGVARIGNYIYMFGGSNASAPTNTIYRTHVDKPTVWENTGLTLPGNLQGMSVAVIGSNVYLFGGWNGSSYTSNILTAATSNLGSWSSAGTLPAAYGLGGIAVVGTKMYLFGGWNGAFMNTIWEANTSSPGSWISIGTLPTTNSSFAMAQIGNDLYIFGGENASTLNVIWSAPASNPATWTSVGTLPAARKKINALIVGDYVYLLGGNTGSVTNTILRAPLNNPTQFIQLTQTLPGNISDAAATVIGGEIYTFGGYNGSAATDVIYRTGTSFYPRQTNVDVSSNFSWLVMNTSAASIPDARIGTLNANNMCSVNGAGALINCTTPAAIGDDTLDFSNFKDALTLDALFDIEATGSNTLSITNSGTAYSFVVNDQAADSSPFAVVADGKISIKALTPTVALDVGGAIVSRAVNAASGTSINFAQGNTAYTAAACGSFTLSGMRDGGQYTLVVKGDGAGPATFTHSGVTVRTGGTMSCISGRQMTFTFIRAGSDVYVSHVMMGFN